MDVAPIIAAVVRSVAPVVAAGGAVARLGVADVAGLTGLDGVGRLLCYVGRFWHDLSTV